jgi:hypothetical protein
MLFLCSLSTSLLIFSMTLKKEESEFGDIKKLAICAMVKS